MQTYEQILKENINYIYKVAIDIGYKDDEDLIQIGKISLFESYTKYDRTSTVPFMKYAGQNVRFAMMNYLTEFSRTIHIPANRVNEDLKRKKKEEDSLFDYQILSTELKTGFNDNDKQLTIGDYLMDDIPEEREFSEEEIILLKKAMKKLKPVERKVLEMKFGINQKLEKEHSYDEISEQTNNTTKQNIHSKITTSITKLKKILNVKLEEKQKIKEKRLFEYNKKYRTENRELLNEKGKEYRIKQKNKNEPTNK